MPDPRETLARIRAQADAATPGPWETDGTGEVSQHWSRPEPWETVVGTEVSCMSYCYGGSAKGAERAEDAKFIAASRTDVPALLDLADAVLDLADELDRDGNAFMSDADPGRAKAAYAHAARIRVAVTTALEGGTRA